MTILVVDNYDSFTYNLVQYLAELGADVLVHRNDDPEVSLEAVKRLNPAGVLLSPGPGTPDDAGETLSLIAGLDSTPIFGVCLGHQSIGQHFGATVVRAGRLMHGRTSKVAHSGQGVFAGLPSPFTATRYHSLIVDPSTVPDCLEVTASVADPDHDVYEIMGLRHKTLPIEGVQFHPESFLTEHGHAMLKNWLDRLSGAV